MNTTLIATRVKRGAKWLDTKHPLWWKRIKLDVLNMGDTQRCVCGQIDSIGYYSFVGYANLSERTQVMYGFYPTSTTFTGEDKYNAELTKQWGKLIRRRQSRA